jgi:HAD superfamily hydrolase (TIGR01484 family)
MRMGYQLIALDMDGTLIGRKGEISVGNREAIRAAVDKGKIVVLATGRPIRNALPYAEQLGLTSPLIINNGSEVWQNGATLHHRHILPVDHVERIFAAIAPYLGERLDFWAHTVEGKIDPTNIPEDKAKFKWLQFAVKSLDPDLLGSLRETFESWGIFDVSNSSPVNVECNPRGVNKGSGLQEVCRLMSVPIEEAIAAGDSLNDISMIRAAGLGVAMGNAQEEVKQAANRAQGDPRIFAPPPPPFLRDIPPERTLRFSRRRSCSAGPGSGASGPTDPSRSRRRIRRSRRSIPTQSVPTSG